MSQHSETPHLCPEGHIQDPLAPYRAIGLDLNHAALLIARDDQNLHPQIVLDGLCMHQPDSFLWQAQGNCINMLAG